MVSVEYALPTCARALVGCWGALIGNIYICSQLRRQARLRREYLYRKSQEDKERSILERKRKLRDALEGMLHTLHTIYTFSPVILKICMSRDQLVCFITQRVVPYRQSSRGMPWSSGRQ